MIMLTITTTIKWWSCTQLSPLLMIIIMMKGTRMECPSLCVFVLSPGPFQRIYGAYPSLFPTNMMMMMKTTNNQKMMKILIKDPLIINDYDDNDDDKDIPSSSMIMTIMIMTNMTKMIIIMLMVMMFKVQNDDDPRQNDNSTPNLHACPLFHRAFSFAPQSPCTGPSKRRRRHYVGKSIIILEPS